MDINTPRQLETDWLVIFLVLNCSEVADLLPQVVATLEKTKLRKTTSIYFLKDTIEGIELPGPHNPRFDLTIEQLVYDGQAGKTILRPFSIPGIDLAGRYAWREGLIALCAMHKAKFSTLITWSHGAGIGLFNPANPGSLVIQQNNTETIRNFKEVRERLHLADTHCSLAQADSQFLVVPRKSAKDDCELLHNLYVSEIANALKDKHRFDMIIMCNCYTQFVDNCYNLQHITRYYLAPITLIQLTGYDFARLINAFNGTSRENFFFRLTARRVLKRPDNQRLRERYCRQLLKIAIDGYVSNSDSSPNEVIIVNDLHKMTALKTRLNDICCYFNQHKKDVYPKIETILSEQDLPFSENDYIDLILFFDAIGKKIRDPLYDRLNHRIRKFLLQEVRVDHHIGRGIAAGLFHVCSIYIPVSLVDRLDAVFCCQYFRNFANAQFVQEICWDNFVKDFTLWRMKMPTSNFCPDH